MKFLHEYAKVLRSKNSGPFEITLDVLFDSEGDYWKVKESGTITRETICAALGIQESSLHHFVFFDQALGFKITIAREIPSGTVGDRDVYGAQQHALLMDILIE